MKYFITAALALAVCMTATAQEKEKKNSKSVSVNIGDGPLIQVDNGKGKGEHKEEAAVKIGWGMLDFAINSIIDNTDYGDAATKAFLQVPAELQNENLFSLRQGKSINVNVWPVTVKFRALDGDRQRIYIGSAVGLQMYNFRFSKNISYLNETNPTVILDSAKFTKNKLALTYLSVPLMVTLKTKLAPKTWLVYGGGVMAGYRISSWTKQRSELRGKDKNHDDFNMNDFNVSVTGEIGLDDYFRLFISYQVTPLHDTYLDQHPLCIGFRFGGI